jgi:threonylcarbamoyladenosine tRNA methylthiotransferase MtaB
MASFFIQQFGCRATQADGAALERQLLDRGCTPAGALDEAEIVILNTCTVTAAADAQARDAIRKLHAQNPAAHLIVTGCYAQRAPEELAILPGVSCVVGNSHKPQIPDLIAPNLGGRASFPVGAQHVTPHLGAQRRMDHQSWDPAASVSQSSSALLPLAALTLDSALPFHSFLNASMGTPSAPILAGDIFARTELLCAPLLGGEAGHTRPTLKIQDGCNLRCSYCVIPYVRGQSHSLPPDAVIREIQKLAGEAWPSAPAAQPFLAVQAPMSQQISSTHFVAREIVLSGINLGTYGRDLTPRTNLLTLLRRILNETPLERLRLSSIEPQDVTQDLVDLFASTGRLAEHFHMPLQSGSDRILAAMHRRYRTGHYARRVELINDLVPHAAIGADVITGFAGETDADHQATVDFIEQHPFTYLHVFSFSARPGTPAAALPHQVPAHIIRSRARQLRALSEDKSAAFRRSQLGRSLRVLTLHRSAHDESNGVTPAISSNYVKLFIPDAHEPNHWLDLSVSAGHLEAHQQKTVDASVLSE